MNRGSLRSAVALLVMVAPLGSLWGAVADLSVTAAVSPGSAAIGAPLTYTLTVSNAGPGAATDVFLLNRLPAVASVVSIQSNSFTCEVSGNVISCHLDSLPAGSAASVAVIARPLSSGLLCDFASVTCAESRSEPSFANNHARICATIANPASGAALSVSESAGPDSVTIGSNLTYTISVRNGGPQPATGVRLTDTLPAGVTVVSVSPGCMVNGGTVTCDIGTLKNGATVTKTIVVSPSSTGTVCNAVSVTGNEPDPVPDDNQQSLCTPVIAAPQAARDLAVVKLTAPATVTLTSKKPSLTKTLTVGVQNRSPHNETITTLDGLVTLTVESLGICPDLVPRLHVGSPQKKLPVTLKPKQTLNVYFDVTFTTNAVNDGARSTTKDPAHADYRYHAQAHHEAIDGLPDTHPEDDVAPRSVRPPYALEPNPDGKLKDRGVGGKKSDGTFGADVLTDVIAPVPVSRPLLAVNDVAQTSAGTPVSIAVLANDSGPRNSVLSVSKFTQPASGAVTFTANVAAYTPNAGFTGVDRFTYTVSDGLGDSAVAKVSVTVSSSSTTNHPPVARDDTATALGIAPVQIRVLDNDSDPDGDPLSVVDFTQPGNGVVSFAGNIATYTANSGFSGANTFTYTISDGRGGTASATVTVTVSQAVTNHAPIAVNDAATTPSHIPVEIAVLANDFDPDGDPLTVISFTQPINGSVTFSNNVATYAPRGGFAGTNTFTYTISDGRGGTATATVTITVIAPQSGPGEFALALTRTLNEVGQPLASVEVEESGPSGQATNTTDGASGVVTLGQTTGDYAWKFSAPDYLPVWRRQTLTNGEVGALPNPRLTRRNANVFILTPIAGGSVSNIASTIQIAFAPGTFSQNSAAQLTPLSAQTLPALLPQGWSPLQAFWLELANEPTAPATLALIPWGPLNGGENAALVRWDETNLLWRALQTIPGDGARALSGSLPGSGAYALVVADAGALAPPSPQIGQALSPSAAVLPDTSALGASGLVNPSISSASRIPELVTADAQVTISNQSGSLPSGLMLRCDVTEDYRLQSGLHRQLPQYESFITGYQRPGDSDLSTLQAEFPLRPLLLFGPEELDVATVHVDVLTPAPFTGGVLSATNGGQAATGDIRLIAGVGDITGVQAAQVRALDPASFADLVSEGLTVVRAFEATVGGIAPGHHLEVRFGTLPANGLFVLARVLAQGGLFGLEPRERLSSDASGELSSLEPAQGERLPGLTGAGQYLLLQVSAPQGLVLGVARNAQGQAVAVLAVRLAPWLTFSASDGGYRLLAPAGAATVSITDLATGDSGQVSVTVTDPATPVVDNVSASQIAPTVVSISPAPNATNVAQVSRVVLAFNEPINPATLLGNAVQLLGASNQPVSASLSLNLANTSVTLLPAAQLDAATRYTVALSTNVADMRGRKLQGANQFFFTTVPLSARDPAAQLIIYQPGATNIPANILARIPAFVPGTNRDIIVVNGTAGAADPGVPVVIANESSGETSTVLSDSDGSFVSLISGREEDFVSATFVSLNGARLYVPVSRQLFDNGFVGLYRRGGILEAQSDGGPVQVLIAPEAIPTRTKFKLAPLNLAQLAIELGGVSPASGTVAGGALRLQLQGDPPTLPLKISFPVDLLRLGYPTNEAPTNAAAALAVVQNSQDTTTFQVVDQMIFHPQSASGAAVPAAAAGVSPAKGKVLSVAGGMPAPLDSEQVYAGVMDTSLGFLPLLPGGQIAQTAFNQVLVPLLFGPRPVVIKGKVGAVPMEVAIAMEKAGVFSQVLNLQMSDQTVNIPYVSDGVNLGVQLGYIKNPLNAVGTVFQLTLTALQQAEVAIAKPLSGAFVTVRLSGGALAAPPGHLFPGMVYATSGADGTFLAVAPAAGAQYLVTCTHPLFQDIKEEPVNPISYNPLQQGDLSLAGAVFKNFLFELPLLSQVQPNVNIAFSPEQPAPGQPCIVQVNAFQPPPLAAPDIHVGLVAIGTNNLLTGLPEANAVGVLTNIVRTTNSNNARWTGTLLVDKPVTATLKIFVAGGNQNFGPIYLTNEFTGPRPPVPVANIPPPDTNDTHGPLVVQTLPPENGFVGEDSTVTVFFNKPIDGSVTNHLAGIVLSLSGAASTSSPIVPILRLSPDQQSLALQFPGLQPAQTYLLTLSGQSIQDLAGHSFDQRPSTTEPDSFTLTFRTPPSASAALPGLVNGRGSVIVRNRLYALDQAPQDNYLLTYGITTPLKPQLLSRTHLFGVPRDLVVIPQFRYVRNVHAPVETNDLVVVVGGDLDAQINNVQGTTVTVKGQYLWVMNMSDPTSPQILASPILSYRVGSAVTKVRWAPPYLVYEEFGADIQRLGFVDLQELLIGYGSTRVQQGEFPPEGKPGISTNADGSYVDSGVYPLPQRQPPEFYGLDYSYVLQHTTQKILDFSVTPGGRAVGVTLQAGWQVLDDGTFGLRLTPSYRTLAFNGPLLTSDPLNGLLRFGSGAYPRWVTVLDQLEFLSNNVPLEIAAALVSLEPDTNGLQELAVIDISLPEQPQLLNKIPIPDSLLGGGIQSVTRRSDGRLEVAGAQNIVLLSPAALGVTDVPAGRLHPAIVDVIPLAGGITRSLGATDYGVRAVADKGRGVVVQSPPEMAFVSFPQNGGLVNPASLHLQSDATLRQVLAGLRNASGLAPARYLPQTNLNIGSDLEPANPALHFHVLVIAPGGSVGANQTIELGLEALNPAGVPFSNLGQGFAPVRAASDTTQQKLGQVPRPTCGAPIRSLTAYRMSDDRLSPFYNYYLSRPFALITEAIQLSDLDRVKGDGGADREILFSGYALRAFIEPSQSADAIFGPFAAQLDPNRKRIYPIASAIGYTVNRSYLVGDNPPPPGGSTPMEDSYGTIQAHSGELRTSDIDLALPSPRLAINIVRTIGNQDNYEGPFGVGWEFNYNQRLTVLDPLVFPEGLQMPLVVRGTKGDSEVAGSQDVLFHSGEGESYHFRWVSKDMPPEYAPDPLVQEFDYPNLVSDYYLPQHGLFDLLVKFKDGRFERLTPGGTRYRYRPDGLLETILDRFPSNRHDLEYDSHGWLVRIDDHSVSAPRFVRFGHYRRQSTDADFAADVDLDTDNQYLEGKICRLLDYAGGDVLFYYSADGFLTNRLGMQVYGENGGYAGRSHTFYTYTGCQLVGVLATLAGIPIVSAETVPSASGKPVAKSSTGSKGNNDYSIPQNNTAATVGSQTTAVKLGDGSSTQRQFDKMGNVSATTVTGTNGPPATAYTSNTMDGLVYYVRYPEGNSRSMLYDTNNPVFRSRGNLLSVSVDPGPRGGQGYTETFHYDPRYNLQSGDQVDANGFHTTYQLTPDGRAVQTITYGSAGSETATYNSNGQRTHTVSESGVEHTVVFNPNTGFVSSQSSGNVSYTYNYDGRYASQYGRPASIAPALGAPTIFSYNNELQEVQVARGDLISKMAYDELGRAIYRQQQVGDGKQWTSHYGYDAKGFVTNLVTEGIEVNGAESSLSYGYTSDDRSRLKSILFPSGALQTYDYDDRGNVTRMKLGSYTETYDHDLNNNLTGVRQGGDLVQVARYDGLDRATNVIHKTGAQDETSASSYYPGGEQQSLTVTDPQFGTLQQQTIDRIDELGRPLQVTVHGTALSPQYQYTYGPLSSSITGPRATATTAWDIAGNQISYTDPNLTTTMHRDDNGRVYQVDRREDGASYSQMFGYDDLDHQISLGDLLGTEFTYLPRADGSQLKVINARGNAATLEHTSMGELLRQRRADGMEVRHRHDQERQVIYEGDPGAGFNFGYDDQLRLTNSTLRSGATVTYGGFDPRNLPTTITIPGGAEIRQYDLQRQLLQRKLNYQSTTWEEDYTYDALGRPRVVTYIQNGGPANTATFDFDPAGPLTQVRYHEDNTDFTVGYAYYSDGFRRSVTYPSGVTVTDVRDVTGRLTGVSDGNGNIISATSWHGNSQPSVVQLGATMQIVNTYDARGRLVGSRVTRLSDGAVLAHARYQFDGVNNLEIRQFVHRGGKADVFGFDTGERVAQAQIGIVLTNVGGFGPALYQRHYDYDATGLDYLSTVTVNGPSSNAPPFATNWTAHDSFLLPGFVDGAARGAADPMGNVAQATLWVRPAGATSAQPVSATLQHDGHGRLIRITRADGLTIENQYQASGLRFSRKVFQGGQLIAYSAYVYDSAARLLEEYDRTAAQPLLIARYYYASGDAPVAADFRDSGSGQLRRYYFLRDNAMSVIALADKDGNVVERAWYDTFGQPQLERRDTSPPTVAKIAADTGGSLLIAMSEPVQAAWTDPGSGGGIVLLPNTITNAIQVTDSNSVPIPGDLTLPASVPGYKQFAALRFTPSQSMIGAVTVTLNAGKLSDEWANTNAALSVTLTNTGPAGAVYYSAPSHADTSPTLLARSDTGSPVLFHGQYFDYDAGLIYLRARFYDPYSGMFFEPDPLGYEDSVNHYAGLGNNPVSLRDPSGLMTSRFRRFLNSERAGYKPHEVAFIEQVHPHLSRLGMGDLEIAAHVRVMMRRLKNNGEHWEVAVRTFGKPGERRHRIEEGYPNKPEEVEVKSNEKAVATHDKDVEIDGQKHRQFTSDMDALYFKRNGEFASYDQYRHFQREVNNEVDRLRKPWQADLAAQGKSVKFDVRQDPYQHGASFSIPEQFGLLHKLSSAKGGASGYFGQEAWNHIADKMTKGPGEGFVISISKEGRFDTHNLSVDRVNQLGRAALDDFKARITEGSGRTDAGLQRRLNAQAIKDGASSATFYPWWLHTGVQ